VRQQNEHRVSLRRAGFAGLVATFVATTLGYWLPGLGLLRLDFPILNGNLIVPDTTAVSFAWLVGAAQTAGLGALLAGIYAGWLRDRLPGRPWLRGTIWGALLGVVSGLTVFPLLYGAGVFGLAWDPVAPVSLAVWYGSWGAALGAQEHLDRF